MPGRSRSAIDAIATAWIANVNSSARSRSREDRSIIEGASSAARGEKAPGDPLYRAA
jgi:hypothetical protein